MYKSFYNLTASPFSLLPDASFLFLSKRHRRVINFLDYNSISQAGFMVISGDVGAGKTTVIRHYLKKLGSDVTVGVVTNPSKTAGRLLSMVAMAFELDDREQNDVKTYNHFVEFLLAQYAKGKRTVLIIDEAQNLTSDMLEDLRMLSNVNNEKDQLLQIILVGQPELLTTLKDPKLRQFVQRVALHCHLTPLDAVETKEYIHHRLQHVGGSPALFDDRACAAVYYFTEGVPRLINLLCDQSLMYAFAEDSPTVSFQTIMEVIGDRDSGGLSPFRNVDTQMTEKEFLKGLQKILDEIRSASE